jgi:phosphopantetheinyl transferase
MPFIYKIEDSNFKLGVWEITEEKDFFYTKLGFCSTKKSGSKRLQYMASRLILKELDSDFDYNNCNDWMLNKPFYIDNSYYFNISHSGIFVVAILSKEMNVGIDVQQYTDRINTIRFKFLNREEIELLAKFNRNEQCDISLLFWTVKESILKYIGNSAFDYLNDITIHEYNPNSNNSVFVKVRNYEKNAMEIKCFKIKNCWVSYCV